MRRLHVGLRFGGSLQQRPVGLLVADGPRLYFAFDAAFRANPLPISPFALRTETEVHEHYDAGFEYLPGLLHDAMPDGWGRLLQDRAFQRLGIPRESITPLDRLAAVGSSGIGALAFSPARSLHPDDAWAWTHELAGLADHARRLYEGNAEDVLPELLAGGGSPGGARPKILADIGWRSSGPELRVESAPAMGGAAIQGAHEFEPWIIKFPTREDGEEAGIVEFVYAQMARVAGIDVPRTHLFEVRDGRRFFGVARFDRLLRGDRWDQRLHMHTLGGLLHADYRLPSCDYSDLLKVAEQLTRNLSAVDQAYRRMVFNVLAMNRDDHARNFAFLMDSAGEWRLSPAYDLSFSSGMGGEHMTAVDGEGRRPTQGHFRSLADGAMITAARASEIEGEVRSAVARWGVFARDAGLSREASARIARALADCDRAVMRG